MNKLKPIKTEQEYDAVLKRIDDIFDAEPGTPEGDELETWFIFVEAYEAVHHQIQAPDPIEAIKYIMAEKGLKNKDLEPFIGHKSRVSELLNRKRGLTIDMARRLFKGLGISAETLLS